MEYDSKSGTVASIECYEMIRFKPRLLAFCAIAPCLTLGTSSGQSVSWVASLRQSARGKAALLKHNKYKIHKTVGPKGTTNSDKGRPSKGTKRAGVAMGLPGPETIPIRRAYFEKIGSYRKAAEQLAQRGQWAEARAKCKELMQFDHGNPSACEDLADIDFHLGNYSEAYDELVPVASPSQSPTVMLRLSLAAAKTGQVFPGQREYVLSFLDHGYFGNNMLPEFIPLLPSGDSPKTLIFLSHLALANLDSLGRWDTLTKFHFDEANKIEPNNVVESYLYSMRYHPRDDGDPHRAFVASRVKPTSRIYKRLNGIWK